MKEAAYCLQFLRGCLALGYLPAVITDLCLNVDKKQAAENLGCECEPPASPFPAELRKSCGCRSSAGSHPRFAAGWELSATEVFWLCTAQIARHPFQDAGMHLPSFSRTQPLAHRSLHIARVLLGHTTQVSFFHSVCRWFSIHVGNHATNGNISTSPNKNKSQQPFHLN